MRWERLLSVLPIFSGLLLIMAPGASLAGTMAAAAPPPRAVTPTPGAAAIGDYRQLLDHVDRDRIAVRFEPGTQARVRDGRLVSLSGADLGVVESIVASVPGARLDPRFRSSETELDRMRRLGEERTRQRLPDLNLFALLTLPRERDEAAAKERLRALLEELNGAPGVAEAWAVPILVPAVVDPPEPVSGAVARRDTPDFSPMQGYLYDSPLGLFADSAWTFPGGKGQGVRVLGLEFGWQWTHEDLKDPFYLTHDQGPSDHGTATIGEIMGQHNGYGVNGVAPDVQIGGIWVEDLASAILEAISVLSPGDVYNMSLQTDGNLPVELWPDWFAAIQTGSALGVNCLEAAGNGGANLDDPGLGGKFDRHVRDSGAVMCGAGRPTNLGAESFSNYGERVSLQAWGSSVVTTGYGDLQGGDPDVRYTANFGGTSSATPMVAGVVASLEGQSLALFGVPLTPWLVEEILSMTGTPYAGDRKIGERPNLAAARGRLLQGFGDVLVTVRDGDSHEPVPDMAIEIEETGRSQLTGPEGQVRMQLTTGALTFHVLGNYFFDEASYPFVVEQGGDQEVTLDLFRRPHGSLAGIVRDERGAGIPGVAVVVAGTPLDTVRTAEDGSYSIPQIPANGGYTALATHVSGKGSDATTFDVAGGEVTVWNPVLVDAETFEDGPAGFAGVGGFELGTPTFPANPHPDPYSGLNCWSTSLHAPYPNNATMTLTSPVYDLSGATELTLSFFHWFWIAGEDGGALQVWDAPHHGWVTVPPLGGYPDTNIPVLNGPGFNGRQTFWNPAIFPLDEWTGGSFQFRLLFRSDATGQLVGWNIDDIAIDTGQGESASIDPAEFSVEITNDLVVEPNPAVRESRIRFALAASSDVKLELYDARGALLRVLETGTLPAGEHAIRWDGLDRAGRPAPPGLYFYKLTAGSATRMTGKLVRLR